MPDATQRSSDSPPSEDGPRCRFSRLPPVWLMTVMATLLTSVAVMLPVWLPWQQRLAVVLEIESMQGRCTIREQGPDWLRSWFGHPYHGFLGNSCIGPCDEIIEVNLSRGNRFSRSPGEITPQLLSRLRVFDKLASLNVSYSTVTDDWMPTVSRFSSREELDLSHCRVSGRGFGSLRRLTGLERIHLTTCPMGDAHLEDLARIPSLKYVGLVYCSRLTTEGVKQFLTSRPDLQVSLYGRRDLQRELIRQGYTPSATGVITPFPHVHRRRYGTPTAALDRRGGMPPVRRQKSIT